MKSFIFGLMFTFLMFSPAHAFWRLTWADNSDNEAEFVIERKEGAGAYIEVGRVPANVTTADDALSQAEVAYCYRIKSVNQYGENTGPEACGFAGSPTAPGMPQLLWRP